MASLIPPSISGVPFLTAESRISIAIPTYNRGEIVLKAISQLMILQPAAREIIVVDQTERHPAAIGRQLASLNETGSIRLVHRSRPSITAAMNFALRQATGALVLFLDDDIVPASELLQGHAAAFGADSDLWATVGQVIQPWQRPEDLAPRRELNGLRRDFDFPFNSTLDADVENVMAGNLCVNRERVLSIGGFDERFTGSAYRFETDFARRLVDSGGKIRFVGSASIHHLHAATGGTRSNGNHMKSASPRHGFGDFYYAFSHGTPGEAWRYSLKRVFREVRTRYHLTHPWWIPLKLTGEIRALIAGRRQARKGPKLLATDESG
ncbi:MAG: glycosyltransferase [Gammaproteobacteria bacterium]|nr:glycosyltransferase [Gammaproteobacteria bacterium]